MLIYADQFVSQGFGGLIIYAGVGIVRGSKTSLEWEELDLKMSQVFRTFLKKKENSKR